MKRTHETPVLRLVHEISRGVDYTSPSQCNPDFPVIDCGLGHTPFGYPDQIDQYKNEFTPQMLIEYAGEDAYSKSLAEPVRKRFGLHDTTDVFFNGAGSYGMMASIFSDLVRKDAVAGGVNIVGFGPQFTNVDMLARRARLQYTSVQPPLDSPIESKLDALIDSRRHAQTPAVVYLDNPNNPLGSSLTAESLMELAEVTQRQDMLIIDEAYGDLIDDKESMIPMVEKYEHLIVMRSLSKGVGLASPRLGYAVMSEPLAAIYKDIELVFAVDSYTAFLGRIALNPDVLATFLPQVRERTAQIKTSLVTGMVDLGVNVYPTDPTVSIFLAENKGEFYKDLLNVSIKTEDGATFIPTHADMSSSLVRIRIPSSLEASDEILARIALIQRSKRN